MLNRIEYEKVKGGIMMCKCDGVNHKCGSDCGCKKQK